MDSLLTSPPRNGIVPDGVAAAALVVTELATNAVQHTASGAPGGVFRVWMVLEPGALRLRVEDGGSPTHTPTVVGLHQAGERGYGLHLVAHFTDRWSVLDNPPGVFAHWT